MSDFEDLKPGTPEAVAEGCTCDRDQAGPPKPYLCNGNCPIHGVAELAAILRNEEGPRPTEHADRAAGATPDHTKKCEACGQPGAWPLTGMCGPCSTGEADSFND